MALLVAAEQESVSEDGRPRKRKEEEDDYIEPAITRVAQHVDDEALVRSDEIDEAGDAGSDLAPLPDEIGSPGEMEEVDPESGSDESAVEAESVGDGWAKLDVPALPVDRDLLANGVEGPRGFNDCCQPIDFLSKFLAPDDLRSVVQSSDMKRTTSPDVATDASRWPRAPQTTPLHRPAAISNQSHRAAEPAPRPLARPIRNHVSSHQQTSPVYDHLIRGSRFPSRCLARPPAPPFPLQRQLSTTSCCQTVHSCFVETVDTQK